MLFQRRLFLAVADVAAVAFAMIASAGLLYGWPASADYLRERWPAVVVPVLAAWPVFFLCGLYSTRRLRSAVGSVVPAIKAAALIVALSLAAWFVMRTPGFGRRFVLELAMMIAAGVVVVRLVVARSRRVLDTPTLVIGSPGLCADVAALLSHHPDAPIRIVGVVPYADDLRLHGAAIFPVLGQLEDLEEIVAEHRIRQVILPARLREHPDLLRRVRPLSYRGVTLVDFANLFEQLAQEVSLEHIDDDWLFSAASAPSQLHIRRLKRAVDIVASLVLFIPAGPLLALAALAIKATSRGPVIFSQERVGIHGESFQVLKLRTMYQDAEKLTGPVWSTDNDPRITPAGRFLRKFRIDELPQLWNVLRGDMSLVGPRPERPMFVDQLSAAIPHYSERLLVRPGVTGWAQVMAPYAATINDSARKLQFDLYYTKNLSLTLDLAILLLTVRTVLFGRERTQGGMSAGRQLEAMPSLNGAANGPAAAEANVVEAAPRRRRRGESRSDIARA